MEAILDAMSMRMRAMCKPALRRLAIGIETLTVGLKYYKGFVPGHQTAHAGEYEVKVKRPHRLGFYTRR